MSKQKKTRYGLTMKNDCYGNYSEKSDVCKECALSASCKKNTFLIKEEENKENTSN